jgi:NADH dehydrogenase
LTLVQADVNQAGVLQAILPGHDIVINLIAILQGSQAQFEQAHIRLPSLLAEACAATGVKRLIHVSAIGAAPEAPSRYLRSKAGGEALLQANAGLALTLLRPSVVFGAGDRFLNLFAKLQAVFPVMPLAGADALFQPVWVEDVASAIVRCVVDKATAGKTYELAGPQRLALRELVQLAGSISGHPRPVLPLPAPLAWAQAVMMELAPGQPLMSRDNLASMLVPNVASGNLPGLAELGITAHSIGAVVPGYLAAGPDRLDALRTKAGR